MCPSLRRESALNDNVHVFWPPSLSSQSPLGVARKPSPPKLKPPTKQVLHGELPLRDALGDVKKVLTESHVEEARAAGAHDAK